MSQQINLYEDRLRPHLEIASGRNLAIAALVMLAVMAGWSFWENREADRHAAVAEASLKEVSDAQERMRALTQAATERKVSPELAAQIENAKAMIAARDDVLKALDSGALGRTSGFSSFMVGFARQVQPDLWLTGFRIAAGGDQIEIRGRLLDPARLPGYVQRLNAVPVFQGRRFAALEMQRVVPEAPSNEAVEAAGQAATDRAPAPRQQPFVEFRLRSEMATDGDVVSRAKGGA